MGVLRLATGMFAIEAIGVEGIAIGVFELVVAVAQVVEDVIDEQCVAGAAEARIELSEPDDVRRVVPSNIDSVVVED